MASSAQSRPSARRAPIPAERYLRLFEMLSPLIGSANVERIASAACEMIAELLEVEACSILAADACQGAGLALLAATHIPREEWASVRVSESSGMCGKVFSSGQPLLLNKPQEFRAFGVEPKSRYGRASCVIVPILGESGAPLGVINVANPKRRRAFGPRDAELLEAAGRLVGSGMQGAQMAREILQMNGRMEEILNHLHVGVVALNAELEVSQCNQRFRAMFAGGSQPAGRPIKDLLEPGLFTLCRRLLRDLGPGATLRQERHQGEREGAPRMLEITALLGNPSCDADAAYLLMIEDISQGEEIKRLREADSIKRSFLRIISHELRTPLTVIGGAIPLLDTITEAGNGSSAAVLSKIRQVLKPNVQRLTNVVNTVLDVVDIENGNLRLARVPMDLNKLIQERVDAARETSEAKRLAWEICLDPDLPPVLGDAQRLRQTFYELFDNQIKFSPAGATVRVRTSREGNVAAVRIANQGEPIHPARREEVFEKFYQLDQTLTRRTGGCGLGLYLARNILLLHQGGIRIVDGEAGETVFRAELPLAEAEPKPA